MKEVIIRCDRCNSHITDRKLLLVLTLECEYDNSRYGVWDICYDCYEELREFLKLQSGYDGPNELPT